VTEPERPAAAPAGNPTPEEISARLEALLKRTHTLRAQRAAPGAAGGSLGMTWPPPDRELDGYDVVDTDNGHTAPPSQASEPIAAPGVTARTADSDPVRTTSDFSRPDWSELRLRAPGDDQGARANWLWALTLVLAVTSVGQAAYIWYLHTTRPAAISGRIRVDAPEGAEVRVNGQAVGIAPVDHALEPGGYDIEVVQQDGTVKADDVVVGLGRTVVLIVPNGSSVATQAAASGQPQTATPGRAPASPRGAAPSSPPPGAPVSPTMGAVVIETVPAGLPVTMGGRARGVTPVTIGMIRPGRHDVMIGTAFRQVDVRANEVTTVRVP
jgi:hypothetical protein